MQQQDPSSDNNGLVGLLGSSDVDKISRTLEAMSSSPANCELMRTHRIIPMLVQILHPGCGDSQQRASREIRRRAARALHNVVHANPADKRCRREAKVLKLIETLRLYADLLRDVRDAAAAGASTFDVVNSDSFNENLVDRGKKLLDNKCSMFNMVILCAQRL